MKLNIKDNAITNLLAMLYRDHGVGYKEPGKVYGTDDYSNFLEKLLSKGIVYSCADTVKINIPSVGEESDFEKEEEFFRTFIGATVIETVQTKTQTEEGEVVEFEEETVTITDLEDVGAGWLHTVPQTGLNLLLGSGYLRVDRNNYSEGNPVMYFVKKIILADGTVVFDGNENAEYSEISRNTVLPIYLGDVSKDDFIEAQTFNYNGEEVNLGTLDYIYSITEGVYGNDKYCPSLIFVTKENSVFRGATFKEKGIYAGGYVYICYPDFEGGYEEQNYEIMYKISTPEITHKIDPDMVDGK